MSPFLQTKVKKSVDRDSKRWVQVANVNPRRNKAVGSAVISTVSKKRKTLPIVADKTAGMDFEGKKTKLVTADHV